MKARILSQWQCGVVNKVQIARNLLKPLTSNAGGNEWIFQFVIQCPIITDLWQLVDPHDYHEPKICLDFFQVSLPSGRSVCCSKALCCKQVGLSDDEGEDLFIKEVR